MNPPGSQNGRDSFSFVASSSANAGYHSGQRTDSAAASESSDARVVRSSSSSGTCKLPLLNNSVYPTCTSDNTFEGPVDRSGNSQLTPGLFEGGARHPRKSNATRLGRVALVGSATSALTL